MSLPENHRRSAKRQALDEQLATAPKLPPLDLPPTASAEPLESHLGRLRRPMPIIGVVENRVVRPLDSTVNLPEHSRVIIIAAETK